MTAVILPRRVPHARARLPWAASQRASALLSSSAHQGTLATFSAIRPAVMGLCCGWWLGVPGCCAFALQSGNRVFGAQGEQVWLTAGPLRRVAGWQSAAPHQLEPAPMGCAHLIEDGRIVQPVAAHFNPRAAARRAFQQAGEQLVRLARSATAANWLTTAHASVRRRPASTSREDLLCT